METTELDKARGVLCRVGRAGNDVERLTADEIAELAALDNEWESGACGNLAAAFSEFWARHETFLAEQKATLDRGGDDAAEIDEAL